MAWLEMDPPEHAAHRSAGRLDTGGIHSLHEVMLLSGEATRAFDRGMEDEVKHDFYARLKMRTTLIVTHRLETIRDVPHLVRIYNGRIRGLGQAGGDEDAGAAGLSHGCDPDFKPGTRGGWEC